MQLEPFSSSQFWKFRRHFGKGGMNVHSGTYGDTVEIYSQGEEGLAATLQSPRIEIDAGREYRLKMEIKTEDLIPISAHITGHAYFRFYDKSKYPGGWYPSGDYGSNDRFDDKSSPLIAPSNSDWMAITQDIKVPTTAGSAELFIVYAGFGYWGEGHPRVTGRAKGKLWIRNVRVEPGNKIPVLPSTIHVSDDIIQAGIETAIRCLHNSALTGRFVVSDGYTISGNIVPDLSFGLFGVRRLGHPEYVALMQNKWESLAGEIILEGRVTSQRVMAQVFFALGVDELFSFSGDKAFLEKFLPLADRTLQFVAKKADQNGLARLVEYGQWRLGEGADWVDWYPTRMEGKTCMFHIWYIHALLRIAALHEEFPGIDGCNNVTTYRALAKQIEESIRRLYWRGDHFTTNIDFQGKPVEQKWCDDQVWAIKWNVASPEQAKQIWHWIDSDPARFEGVPMTWAAFNGRLPNRTRWYRRRRIPWHGRDSWFGRHGAGDILARYQSKNDTRAMELLQRISGIFSRDQNVYEAYDMRGNVYVGTGGWGNYTEHCGGYIWAVIEGPFGISFESDLEATATMEIRFPESWSTADATIFLRGTRITIAFRRDTHDSFLKLFGEGEPRSIRIILPNGTAQIIRVGTGNSQDIQYTT